MRAGTRRLLVCGRNSASFRFQSEWVSLRRNDLTVFVGSGIFDLNGIAHLGAPKGIGIGASSTAHYRAL
jgi:hypothetical protein